MPMYFLHLCSQLRFLCSFPQQMYMQYFPLPLPSFRQKSFSTFYFSFPTTSCVHFRPTSHFIYKYIIFCFPDGCFLLLRSPEPRIASPQNCLPEVPSAVYIQLINFIIRNFFFLLRKITHSSSSVNPDLNSSEKIFPGWADLKSLQGA